MNGRNSGCTRTPHKGLPADEGLAVRLSFQVLLAYKELDGVCSSEGSVSLRGIPIFQLEHDGALDFVIGRKQGEKGCFGGFCGRFFLLCPGFLLFHGCFSNQDPQALLGHKSSKH